MSAFIDLTGQRFGKLIAIESTKGDEHGNRLWLCKCDCGKEKVIIGASLTAHKTKSCGCLRNSRENHAHTHLYSGTPTYSVWCGMIQRCTNPNRNNWESYGGRGITIDPSWYKFENFLADMKEKPGNEYSIDRIDNSRGYSPENCKWSTRKEQHSNTQRTRYLTYNGETLSVMQWEQKTHIGHKRIESRISRGWSIEEALFTPLGVRKDNTK